MHRQALGIQRILWSLFGVSNNVTRTRAYQADMEHQVHTRGRRGRRYEHAGVLADCCHILELKLGSPFSLACNMTQSANS